MKEVYYTTIDGTCHIPDAVSVNMEKEGKQYCFMIYYWSKKHKLEIDRVLMSEVRSIVLYDKNNVFFKYEK